MPGVIGASIFSPRPARGYRFHSLQVEIILGPLAASKAATIFDKFSQRRRLFVPRSERVTTKLVPQLFPAMTISRLPRNVTDNATNSIANYGKCCSSVAPPWGFGL